MLVTNVTCTESSFSSSFACFIKISVYSFIILVYFNILICSFILFKLGYETEGCSCCYKIKIFLVFAYLLCLLPFS